MQRLRCLMRKEFLELRQNPRLFGIVIVAPIIQLAMLGYAATTDVRNVPVVIVDADRSSARASRGLDNATGSGRGASGCQRWWRLGADDHFDADRVGPCPAPGGRLGQYD